MTGNADKIGAALARAAAPNEPAEAAPPPPLRLWRGIVSAVAPGGAYGLATVKLDGVNETPLIPYLVQPSVNDLVYVLEQGPLRLILGPAVP